MYWHHQGSAFTISAQLNHKRTPRTKVILCYYGRCAAGNTTYQGPCLFPNNQGQPGKFQEDWDNKEANLGYGKAKAANNLAIEKLIQNTGVNIVVAKLEDDAAAPFTLEVLIGHTLWLLLHEHLDGLLK
jgi:hypothetical protein